MEIIVAYLLGIITGFVICAQFTVRELKRRGLWRAWGASAERTETKR